MLDDVILMQHESMQLLFFSVTATAKNWTFWFTKNPSTGEQMGNFELTN
jgi:hypothetical protein